MYPNPPPTSLFLLHSGNQCGNIHCKLISKAWAHLVTLEGSHFDRAVGDIALNIAKIKSMLQNLPFYRYHRPRHRQNAGKIKLATIKIIIVAAEREQ